MSLVIYAISKSLIVVTYLPIQTTRISLTNILIKHQNTIINKLKNNNSEIF